jgi:hypothetical protein
MLVQRGGIRACSFFRASMMKRGKMYRKKCNRKIAIAFEALWAERAVFEQCRRLTHVCKANPDSVSHCVNLDGRLLQNQMLLCSASLSTRASNQLLCSQPAAQLSTQENSGSVRSNELGVWTPAGYAAKVRSLKFDTTRANLDAWRVQINWGKSLAGRTGRQNCRFCQSICHGRRLESLFSPEWPQKCERSAKEHR